MFPHVDVREATTAVMENRERLQAYLTPTAAPWTLSRRRSSTCPGHPAKRRLVADRS
jgi:hypothetical protein